MVSMKLLVGCLAAVLVVVAGRHWDDDNRQGGRSEDSNQGGGSQGSQWGGSHDSSNNQMNGMDDNNGRGRGDRGSDCDNNGFGKFGSHFKGFDGGDPATCQFMKNLADMPDKPNMFGMDNETQAKIEAVWESYKNGSGNNCTDEITAVHTIFSNFFIAKIQKAAENVSDEAKTLMNQGIQLFNAWNTASPSAQAELKQIQENAFGMNDDNNGNSWHHGGSGDNSNSWRGSSDNSNSWHSGSASSSSQNVRSNGRHH